jgi:tRNA1Val (adenine37-N6)-methyltransferase
MVISFKKFSIHNELSAMRVGSDAVLLGAWIDTSGSTNMLDIGTGTGVIALMVAQRSTDRFRITAIDIDEISSQEAALNFEESPWSEHLQAKNLSLSAFTNSIEEEKFDHIFSNPPYFTDSLPNPDIRLFRARHAASLPQQELISSSLKLLSDRGKLSIILPLKEGSQFAIEALVKGLYLQRQCFVKSSPKKQAKRIMMEFAKYPAQHIESQELIMNSCEYADLMRDYLLSF